MHAVQCAWTLVDMRAEVDRKKLRHLMQVLAEGAPPATPFRVYLVGGGTAVYAGWRESSIDVDLFADNDAIFHDIQRVKERLNVNVEFVRPEHFVPALDGTADRHIPVDTFGRVSFLHYDPYAQILAKIVRGFERDLDDARAFIESGMVEPALLTALVGAIPDAAYAKYPSLTRAAVATAVSDFVSRVAS